MGAFAAAQNESGHDACWNMLQARTVKGRGPGHDQAEKHNLPCPNRWFAQMQAAICSAFCRAFHMRSASRLSSVKEGQQQEYHTIKKVGTICTRTDICRIIKSFVTTSDGEQDAEDCC